jgi:hypothetical protein
MGKPSLRFYCRNLNSPDVFKAEKVIGFAAGS